MHASYANENPDLVDGNNERLEFLGDAVLGLIVSRILFERFPEADEGGLTAHRASIVNRMSLASLADDLALDRYLRLGRGSSRPAVPSDPPSWPPRSRPSWVLSTSAKGSTPPSGHSTAPHRPPGQPDHADALKSAKVAQEWSQRYQGTRPQCELVSSRAGPPSTSRSLSSSDRATGHGIGEQPSARRGACRGGRRSNSWRRPARDPPQGASSPRLPRGFASRRVRNHAAVIRPNGSGKSNMADAIRWVLGEQSNRSLRTRRSDDVIFVGSGKPKADRHGRGHPDPRQPRRVAADRLRGSDDGAPRVPFRDPEYLINGSRARLRDVVELLAGAGWARTSWWSSARGRSMRRSLCAPKNGASCSRRRPA